MAISTELSIYHAATMIGKQIQADLEAMIRAELMKHAENIVDEVALEIAKKIKSNLVGYKNHLNDQTVLHLNIDGVEKAKL